MEDSPWLFICPHLWKVQKPLSLAAFTEWKTVTMFFLALCRYTADCFAEVTHALRWHSEKPTSVYSTTNDDKRRSYPDTLFSESMPGFFSGFAVQISVASSIALLRSLKVRIAYNASKTASIAAEQRALLVFPARNSIWDHFVGRLVNASSIV